MSGPMTEAPDYDAVMRATATPEGGEIGDALGYLGACISRLQDGMERLERRLDPALAPCSPPVDARGLADDQPATSELRATIHHQAYRISRLGDGVDELLARLEL